MHDDRMMMMHIVAVLLSLATLAERAIGDQPHIRRLVLFVLRPAEAVARGLLVSEGGRSLRGLLSPLDGDGPEHARRLAVCFRALALALIAVLAQSRPSGASPEQAHGSWHQRCRPAPHPLAFAPAPFPDTS